MDAEAAAFEKGYGRQLAGGELADDPIEQYDD